MSFPFYLRITLLKDLKEKENMNANKKNYKLCYIELVVQEISG